DPADLAAFAGGGGGGELLGDGGEARPTLDLLDQPCRVLPDLVFALEIVHRDLDLGDPVLRNVLRALQVGDDLVDLVLADGDLRGELLTDDLVPGEGRAQLLD